MQNTPSQLTSICPLGSSTICCTSPVGSPSATVQCRCPLMWFTQTSKHHRRSKSFRLIIFNVRNPMAKLRLSERNAKFIWAFPNESNFDEVKVTIKWEKCQIFGAANAKKICLHNFCWVVTKINRRLIYLSFSEREFLTPRNYEALYRCEKHWDNCLFCPKYTFETSICPFGRIRRMSLDGGDVLKWKRTPIFALSIWLIWILT